MKLTLVVPSVLVRTDRRAEHRMGTEECSLGLKDMIGAQFLVADEEVP